MSLSEDEKSRLDEIAAHVLATDPEFVLRLRATAARHPSTQPAPSPHPAGSGPAGPARVPAADGARQLNRRLIMLSWVLFVGIALLSNGWTAAQGLISLGSLVAASGAALTGWTAVQLMRLHRAYRARPA